MIKQHICKAIPKSVTVDYDPEFNWGILSQQGIIEIQYCPWCGTKLMAEKHLVFYKNILDGHGLPVYIKGFPYAIKSETEYSYVIEGCQSFPRSQEDILFYVEGGIQ